MNDLTRLRDHLATIGDLHSAAALLRWDQETYMPPGGAGIRARQLATLSRLAHERFTSPLTGSLLEETEPLLRRLDSDSDDAALLRVTRRDFDRARKLPAEFVEERARAASESIDAWRTARPGNDFSAFRPHLQRMVEFARRTADYLGYTQHPYDALIDLYEPETTTRDVAALFGAFHEAGHALYSQGSAPSLARTPLDDGASNGIHESQSRLWENLVGRSRPFWQYAFPGLRQRFPAKLGSADAELFYRAVNRVRPSLIRVEADEVTYNLHIILRFELEQALTAGDLDVTDLPEAWNAKMAEFLGVTPPDDADGLMQDIHWSGGMIGYFPSYTIGNVASVQFFEAAQRAHPGLAEDIRLGRFSTLLGWLRDHVHAHGRKFLPRDLLLRATGDPLTPEPYLRYLREKFGEIYGLGGGA